MRRKLVSQRNTTNMDHSLPSQRLDTSPTRQPRMRASIVGCRHDKWVKSRGDVGVVQVDNFQVSMIAIGGAIGTGLIIGTGTALANTGPASIVISYSLVGMLVYVVMVRTLRQECINQKLTCHFCTRHPLEK